MGRAADNNDKAGAPGAIPPAVLDPAPDAPARACVRVVMESFDGRHSSHLQALISKVVGAFLESRWLWPRHFEMMTPSAYLLSDPRFTRLDLDELKHLASELQAKLFGIDGAGAVDLLVFEGDDVSLHHFARLEPEAISRLLKGEDALALHGSLSRVGPSGVSPVEIAAATDGKPAFLDEAPAFEPGFRGVYFAPKGVFMSSLTMLKPFGATTARCVLDSAEAIPGVPPETYDHACLQALGEVLQRWRPKGLIITPMCFSSLVRSSGRAAYLAWMEALPTEHAAHLGVTIYDTPRTPSYFALSQMVAMLRQHIGGQISVTVTDPGFDVEGLVPGVDVVCYAVQGKDAQSRLASIRRFAEQLPVFRRKRVWPLLEGLKSKAELELGVARGVPLLSGQAVTSFLAMPLNGRLSSPQALPILA